ncbi:MAG: monovalent cation/H+ antiporter complex subunit F [Eubacteriales bacterium]|jgi:multicomponent Na+:H+ antiporter subunit F|nr:cation:proton antiporter [Bacillota bacterium]MBV1727697.1 cation:proton antiporter [Desulforudis sp.]MDP3051637.1 monovalent cation/H+ antiporter complex subunit F [Eubacteriales bacterium]MDQ7788520.1 monovalent cation/H+ antiporter complex subunit F [Clostridia bacterium]MBU4532759.1 cation:proton antiporter [Bacillota bacterium]
MSDALIFEIAAIVILLAVFLVLYRTIVGPRLYDRALGANVMGTKTVVLLALIGFIYARPDFLDIALVYALINFIATLAILKYRETWGLD